MHVVTIDLPELGNRCHLVHDGSQALVVDPPRDLASVEAAAEEAGVDIAAVADTHVHNDYVSGRPRRSPAGTAPTTCSPPTSRSTFERVGVRDGDVVGVGSARRPGARHARATPATTSPSSRCPATRRRPPGRALQRRQPAARHGRPHRPARPTCSRATSPAPSGPAPARSATLDADDPAAPHPRLRQLLRRRHGRARRRRRRPIGGAARGQPGAPARPGAVRRRPGRRLRPVPAYYEHMAAAQPGGRRPPARPLPAQPLTRGRGAPTRWPTAPGSSTCAARGGSPTAHLAGTVSVEYSPPVRDVRRLAGAVGRPARAAHRPAGRPRRRAARPRRHRHRRRRHPRARPGRAAARDLPAHGLGRLPRRATRARVVVDVRQRDEFDAGHLPGAVHLPVHEVERRRPTLPAGRALGALPLRLPRRHRRQPAPPRGPPRVHVDDDWARVDGARDPHDQRTVSRPERPRHVTINSIAAPGPLPHHGSSPARTGVPMTERRRDMSTTVLGLSADRSLSPLEHPTMSHDSSRPAVLL